MNRQKWWDLLVYTTTGFTFGHALLVFWMSGNWAHYEQISLHYADSLTWYGIVFVMPLLVGLICYLLLRNVRIRRGYKLLLGLLTILQLGFTGFAAIQNKVYWGYAFKRPAVFSEVDDATRVLTCSSVSNVYPEAGNFGALHVVIDSTRSMEHLYGRKDIYYGNTDRIFMAIEDREYAYDGLVQLPEVYQDPNLKASPKRLQAMEAAIRMDGHLDSRGSSGQLAGMVTEFETETGERYLFAGLKGGEVSNDHYPYYEFLFTLREGEYVLTKELRYYIDVAGIEGTEYANLAPLFSLVLIVLGLVVACLIGMVSWVMRKVNPGID